MDYQEPTHLAAYHHPPYPHQTQPQFLFNPPQQNPSPNPNPSFEYLYHSSFHDVAAVPPPIEPIYPVVDHGVRYASQAVPPPVEPIYLAVDHGGRYASRDVPPPVESIYPVFDHGGRYASQAAVHGGDYNVGSGRLPTHYHDPNWASNARFEDYRGNPVLFPNSSIMISRVQTAFPLAPILEQNKLTGSNFSEWYRTLRIVLKQVKKDYVLDAPLPEEPSMFATRLERGAYVKKVDEANEVSCLMLVSMVPNLQRRFVDWKAYDMVQQLKDMFQERARVERFRISKELFGCRMTEGSSVSAHVQKLIGLIEQLGKLGSNMDLELSTDLILNSLPSSYDMFVMNYNMGGVVKPLNELHSLLTTAETTIRRGPSVLAVTIKGKKKQKALKAKGKRKARDKHKAGSQGKVKVAKKSEPTLDTVCFYCNGKGHYKRDCSKFLEEQRAGRVLSASGAEK